MRVIITGDEVVNGYNYKDVFELINKSNIKITTILSSCNAGVDYMAQKYARFNNIPIEKYKPDFKYYGLGATHIRDRKMIFNSDALIIIFKKETMRINYMIAQSKINKNKVKIYRLGIE